MKSTFCIVFVIIASYFLYTLQSIHATISQVIQPTGSLVEILNDDLVVIDTKYSPDLSQPQSQSKSFNSNQPHEMHSKAQTPGTYTGDFPRYIQFNAAGIYDPVFLAAGFPLYSLENVVIGMYASPPYAGYRYFATNYDARIIPTNPSVYLHEWLDATLNHPLPITYFPSGCTPPTFNTNHANGSPSNDFNYMLPVSLGNCIDAKWVSDKFVDNGWPKTPSTNPFTGADEYQAGQYFKYLVVEIPGITTTTAAINIVDPRDIQITLATPDQSGARGDPQFNGVQGQVFQIHGIPDNYFSIVSHTNLQMNALFTYLSSGSCNYNDTACWTHPGTYMSEIGIQIGSSDSMNLIRFESGSYSKGMSVFVNNKKIDHSIQFYNNDDKTKYASLKFHVDTVKNDVAVNKQVEFETELFYFKLVNSDYFINLDYYLKDGRIVSAGSIPLTIPSNICNGNVKDKVSALDHGLGVDGHDIHVDNSIESQLNLVYPNFPLHGLLGQTWRNVKFCGSSFIQGDIGDYITDELFSTNSKYSQFSQ